MLRSLEEMERRGNIGDTGTWRFESRAEIFIGYLLNVLSMVGTKKVSRGHDRYMMSEIAEKRRAETGLAFSGLAEREYPLGYRSG
jgi:hypothetical protein